MCFAYFEGLLLKSLQVVDGHSVNYSLLTCMKARISNPGIAQGSLQLTGVTL